MTNSKPIIVGYGRLTPPRVIVDLTAIVNQRDRKNVVQWIRGFTDDVENVYEGWNYTEFTPKTNLSEILKLVKDVVTDLSLNFPVKPGEAFQEAMAEELTKTKETNLTVTANLVADTHTADSWLIQLDPYPVTVETANLISTIQTYNSNLEYVVKDREFSLLASVNNRQELLKTWTIIKDWFKARPQFELNPIGPLYLLDEVDPEYVVIKQVYDKSLRVTFFGKLVEARKELDGCLNLLGYTFWYDTTVPHRPIVINVPDNSLGKLAIALKDWFESKGIQVEGNG